MKHYIYPEDREAKFRETHNSVGLPLLLLPTTALKTLVEALTGGESHQIQIANKFQIG